MVLQVGGAGARSARPPFTVPPRVLDHGHPFRVARDYMDAIGFRPDDATLEDVKTLLRSCLTACRRYKAQFKKAEKYGLGLAIGDVPDPRLKGALIVVLGTAAG